MYTVVSVLMGNNNNDGWVGDCFMQKEPAGGGVFE